MRALLQSNKKMSSGRKDDRQSHRRRDSRTTTPFRESRSSHLHAFNPSSPRTLREGVLRAHVRSRIASRTRRRRYVCRRRSRTASLDLSGGVVSGVLGRKTASPRGSARAPLDLPQGSNAWLARARMCVYTRAIRRCRSVRSEKPSIGCPVDVEETRRRRRKKKQKRVKPRARRTTSYVCPYSLAAADRLFLVGVEIAARTFARFFARDHPRRRLRRR